MNKLTMTVSKSFDFQETLKHFNYDMIEIISCLPYGNNELFVTCNWHKQQEIIRSGNLNQTAYKLVASGILQDSNIDSVVVDNTKGYQKSITLYYYFSYADFLALEKNYNDEYLFTA